jgi:hypothetical protein
MAAPLQRDLDALDAAMKALDEDFDHLTTSALAERLVEVGCQLVRCKAEHARLEAVHARLSRPLRTVAPQIPIPVEATAEGDPYFVSLVSRVKYERANTMHARTLALLAAHLQSQNIGVGCNQLIDGFAQLGPGPAIFEVKSITAANERSQCRAAVAQLNEYQYLHRLSAASLWIVLSEQPTIPWMGDYLRSHCKLHLVWVAGDELTGPDVGGLG